MDTPDSNDSGHSNRLSIAVINAIAEFEDANPTEIQPVLYDIVDPDALDDLFTDTQCGRSRANGNVSFRYGEHEVTVHDDGNVDIQPIQSPVDSTAFDSAAPDSTRSESSTQSSRTPTGDH